ncbi:solute carrier family 25 (mitochondrial carnitine/acylcarnitine transporter), member 20/29 [Cryptococcus neoformans]|nr:solute carrier family 25 (mitochondrial carnitine/acylcarnitine transporter), member 20/29 [Cryptococcus neoformans var. grubii]
MAAPEEISDPDIYSDIPEGRSGSPQKEHSPFIGFAAGICSGLHNYRAFLSAHGLGEQVPNSDQKRLSLLGHSVAGLFAGWTNATVAHPTEIIKCKLQLQLVQPEHVPRQFSGPIEVVRQTVTEQGVTGMWRGLGASFIYRSCFAAMFGSFEIFNRLFKSWDGTNWAMSAGLANFLAGVERLYV